MGKALFSGLSVCALTLLGGTVVAASMMAVAFCFVSG